MDQSTDGDGEGSNSDSGDGETDGSIFDITPIVDGLSNILEEITRIGTTIIEGITDVLKMLFVPADGFLDDSIESLKGQLAEKFDFSTYEELMNALESHVEGTIDFDGYIDISMWVGKIPTLKNLIRGFFYPLILIGDYNFIIWLLRGTKMSSGSQTALWD